MTNSRIPVAVTGETSHGDTAIVYPPADTAHRLGVSLSQLRKLTRAGAIGHVRLGLGAQRAHIGYTEAHIRAFLTARDVAPAVPEPQQPQPAQPARVRRHRNGPAPESAADVVADVVARAPKWGR